MKNFLEKFGALKLAALVAGILALFILVVERPGSGPFQSGRFVIPSMTIEGTTKVDVGHFSFEKKEDRWMIDGTIPFPVSPEDMQGLLSGLHDLTLQTVVSKNPAKEAEFGVDEASGGHVRVWQGARLLADFYAGRTAGLNDGYIRMAESPETLQATPSLQGFVSRTEDDWKDKTLLRTDATHVKHISLTEGATDTVLEKKPEGWSVVQPEEYKPKDGSVEDLLSQIANFKADGFASEADAGDYDIHNPERKISVRLDDNSMQFVYFLKKDDKGNVLAKNGNDGAIYRVAAVKVDKLFGVSFK